MMSEISYPYAEAAEETAEAGEEIEFTEAAEETET
jgi:hypothetical protein